MTANGRCDCGNICSYYSQDLQKWVCGAFCKSMPGLTDKGIHTGAGIQTITKVDSVGNRADRRLARKGK